MGPPRSGGVTGGVAPPGEIQRVGLSATVRPVEEVATFLGGTRAVSIVQPPSPKRIELKVVVPVEDMTELDTMPARGGDADEEDRVPRRSIWPHVEERVLDLIEQHKSTIVFANSRRLAERLCGRLNELSAERAEGMAEAAAGNRMPAEVMAQAGAGYTAGAGAPAEVARAHHGSVSRQERAEIEEALKAGRLPAVVATSSLELGIDMGAVDLVVQVEAPPSVASGLQRVGRAGHNVGDVSRGIIFPKYQGDLLQSAVVAERMRAGEIEELKIPHNPLDVLAQQIVAMTAVDDWLVDELEQTVRKAAPFGGLTRPVLEAVLDMLAGRYPSEDFAGLRPRIVWAARFPTAACSACSWPRRPRAGSRGGWANSTRRWCTSRGSATCSCSAPARGGSRTSRRTGCWSRPRLASRASCPSGTATRRAGPPSSAGPSARPAASWPPPERTRPPPSWSRPAWTSWRRAT